MPTPDIVYSYYYFTLLLVASTLPPASCSAVASNHDDEDDRPTLAPEWLKPTTTVGTPNASGVGHGSITLYN